MHSSSMSAPPATAQVYLGYEALIRRYQLRVPPLRSVSVGVDRAVERHIMTADGEEMAAMMDNLFSPGIMGVLMGFSLLPILGFLIWVLRFFRQSNESREHL